MTEDGSFIDNIEKIDEKLLRLDLETAKKMTTEKQKWEDQKKWEEQKLIATIAVKEFYPHYIDKDIDFNQKSLYSVLGAKIFVETSKLSFDDLERRISK